jgi:hypothetical protein
MKICEELGKQRVCEIDPETGELTILDEKHGITLNPVQVLALSGILGQYSALIYRAALEAVERQVHS